MSFNMISLHGRVAYLLYHRMLYRLVVITSLRNLSNWTLAKLNNIFPRIAGMGWYYLADSWVFLISFGVSVRM